MKVLEECGAGSEVRALAVRECNRVAPASTAAILNADAAAPAGDYVAITSCLGSQMGTRLTYPARA